MPGSAQISRKSFVIQSSNTVQGYMVDGHYWLSILYLEITLIDTYGTTVFFKKVEFSIDVKVMKSKMKPLHTIS